MRIQDNELTHKCNCRIGEKGGVCSHLIGLTILLYLKQKIQLDQFPFPIKKSWLNEVLNVKEEILNNSADVNEADIDMNEYWIFIRGNTITTKWAGDYAGTKSFDIDELNKTKKKPTTVEDWVVTKVVDKQLESLRRYGRVREILTDRFGVIDKILANKKQFSRLQKAFERAAEKHNLEEVPQAPEEIRKALRIGLIE
jgi:hypothetical protein